MGKKYTTLMYKDLDGSHKTVDLPTIQDLTMPDEGQLPSKPTVTGQYRQQHTVSAPSKISFTMWIETGSYAGATLNDMKMVDVFRYLKKHKLKFKMSTSHTTDSFFLNDLVVESVRYARSSENRDRLVAVVTCTQMQTVELSWEIIDNADIFGYNIFTGAGSNKTAERQFVPGMADEELKLTDTGLLDRLWQFGHKVIYGPNDIPVSERVGSYIVDNLPPCDDSIYYSLGSPIDLNIGAPGTKNFKCSASFPTLLFSDNDETYDVNLIELEVEVEKLKSVDTVGQFHIAVLRTGGWSQIEGDVLATGLHTLPRGTTTLSAINNFSNTYRNFSASGSFETFTEYNELQDYVSSLSDGMISNDSTKMGTGSIVYNDDKKVLVYPIADQYDVNVKFNGEVLDFKSDITGGFDIGHVKLTSDDGFKIDAGEYQNSWDNYFTTGNADAPQYSIHIVRVLVGTKLQLYLLSPGILDEGQVRF